MTWLLWTLAIVALLMAWSARKRAAALQDKLDEVRREATMKGADTEEVKADVDVVRKLLAAMANGHEVDGQMVREGRLYRNTNAADLQQSFEAGDKPYVLDVRSAQEWGTGHIPGAVHMPVDQLEQRLSEVRRDGKPMYVVCASGGRSSSASDYLAKRGYLNVWNVEGGMNAWRGEVQRS